MERKEKIPWMGSFVSMPPIYWFFCFPLYFISYFFLIHPRKLFFLSLLLFTKFVVIIIIRLEMLYKWRSIYLWCYQDFSLYIQSLFWRVFPHFLSSLTLIDIDGMEMKCDEMKNDGRKEKEMNVINIEQGYWIFQSKCD